MKLTHHLLAIAAMTLSLSATAQEATIRKALAERIPQMDKIDEVPAKPWEPTGFEHTPTWLSRLPFGNLPFIL
jgi:hypothetical protein